MPEEITLTAEQTATPAPKAKRKYTKKTTATTHDPIRRAVEILDDVDPRKMTDDEKNTYIAYARAVIAQKTAQLKNLDDTAKQVFQRGSDYERAYNELKSKVEKDMQIIRTSATIFAESIINHTFGGK